MMSSSLLEPAITPTYVACAKRLEFGNEVVGFSTFRKNAP